VSVTVSSIFGRARWIAEQENHTAFNTDAKLMDEFNASMRFIRRELFKVRSPAVLTTITFNSPAGATSGFAGTVLDPGLTGDDVIAGVELLKAQIGGAWTPPLRDVGQDAEADWQYSSASLSTGPPEAYALIDYSATGDGLRLMVLPACDKAYPMALTYFPQWDDLLVANILTDTVQTDLPLDEWLVLDLARKMSLRDEPDSGRFVNDCNVMLAQILGAHRRLRRKYPAPVRPVPLPISHRRVL